MTTGFATLGILALDTPVEIALDSSGVLNITQAYVTVAAFSGTSDDLVGITIDAALESALGGALPFVVLVPKSGHTITIDHDAAPSASEIYLSGGANFVMNAAQACVLWRVGSAWSDGLALTPASGGFVTLNGTQTLTNKTLTSPTESNPTAQTSFTLDGIIGSFASAQEVTLQAGLRTTDATVTTIASITVAESRGIVMHATVIGVKSDHTEACGGDILYMARRASGGNVTEIAAATIRQAEDSGLSTPAISADVDTGTQTMRIRVAGVLAQNWDWVVTYSYHFVASNA